MAANKRMSWWRQDKFAWGVILIALGTWFLLVTSGTLSDDSWHTWWPFAVVAVGLVGLLTARDPKSVGSAVTTLGIGLWLAAAIHHWYGLNWRNSWPLALVAAGLGSITEWVASLLAARKEGGDHVG